ncbi:nitrate/nitrite transporter NrtS [Marinobacter sp. SS13-12]|uniref:nitrate/nitrite transporter NrtS n=1 Tax=Marinobacter sp. SS13-12 TaxID=3050451 RepID=UPI0025577061|nr:nitrate/nitrite transporter NrtS [Marinobacter sp. SS13-12]MDK8462307.1 nitrate/nitrite transporter NrtS [Marinobacter sp. SS13-12]
MSFSRSGHSLRRCKEACQLAVRDGTPVRAAKLALVVGTLLVLINQWEAVVGEPEVNWLKVLLTYCVPYLVSTYTSVSKDLHLLRQSRIAEQEVHQEAEKARFRRSTL